MQIEKVRIKGFRNFVDEEIVFAQQTLIIGPNDIGKTNLLYALRILLDRSLSDRDLDLEISDYNIYSVEKEVQITLYFTDVVEDCIRSSFKGHIKNNTFMLRYSKKPMSEYVIQCGYSEETLEEVCEALNIPFVMRTDNDIFKVPWTNKFHYAGVSRVMGIYKEILSRKNEKLLEYWEENESKSKWECDAAEHNEADIIRDYISQAMMKYGIYLSDVDLETDIANSFLYDSLSEFYGITDKTMLIKEMQKRKAENMLSYMEACIEKKMSFSELKGDKLLLPIYQLIDKARRNTYGK